MTAFSLDPYQIGYENEEGIESGAFWFYRKLGFRPTRRETLRLAQKEEEKIATRKGYRTSAATLRRLAESPMIFELDHERRGDWDRFQVRKIGFKAQRQKRSGLAAVLALIPDLGERRLLERIVRAKMGEEERMYLRLMQRHNQLRSEMIRLGS